MSLLWSGTIKILNRQVAVLPPHFTKNTSASSLHTAVPALQVLCNQKSAILRNLLLQAKCYKQNKINCTFRLAIHKVTVSTVADRHHYICSYKAMWPGEPSEKVVHIPGNMTMSCSHSVYLFIFRESQGWDLILNTQLQIQLHQWSMRFVVQCWNTRFPPTNNAWHTHAYMRMYTQHVCLWMHFSSVHIRRHKHTVCIFLSIISGLALEKVGLPIRQHFQSLISLQMWYVVL